MKKIILAISIIAMTGPGYGNNIKDPNVSGQFYTANPVALSAQIDKFIEQAQVQPSQKDILIVLSPHAGYVYSGGVAAHSFKAVSKKDVDTVVVIAASHYFPYDGVSIWQEGAFKTPLGTVPVDDAFAKKLILKNEKFYYKPLVFEKEHSVEVQIPFLQKTFADFRIVPVLMGQASYDLCHDLAKSLDELIGDREDVLVVVSTDMSHFHTDDKAREIDQNTLQAIANFEHKKIYDNCKAHKGMELCGFVPVTTALLLAKERGLTGIERLSYATSGDVSGDKSRVVGYTSMIIFDEGNSSSDNGQQNEETEVDGVKPLTHAQKKELMRIAKETIHHFVKTGTQKDFTSGDPRLEAVEGAFVTIHKKGKLRGCIGNIIGQGPLYQTVRNMAVAAASHDPRFAPVTTDELKDIDIEISVLSQPQVVDDPQVIEMGVHGVIVSQGIFRKGVFLPQVADETGWTREQFLSRLCAQKAGLPPDAWKDPETKIEIFTANVFAEHDVQ